MANPSKQTPWVVEMETAERWYAISAYRSEDEAEAYLVLTRKRAPQAEWRVRKLEKK